MNFKRAFTLVEMIIVLIIISIVFLALGLISWSYVTKLNLENDKETLDGVFSYVQSASLSQAVYKN
jgi:prepilin-type N-terminal cleavage/methylation domain-containing protein